MTRHPNAKDGRVRQDDPQEDATSPSAPFDELIELIARLAARRRLRETKEALTHEDTQQPNHESEKP
ncbi:hypothetical protein [Aporhodopirellula aestuarii]|uniref:Uncharacterized protein n=1 Tax=Aporhodopirellula aestuarii TaxID=2950107 RepID=A0ABT0UAD8_9BACT|nr:hypothetical protein [Aporhodopirellula aestuarii]MCM2373927.1 hypothetical protein [Aporhodopirellula aestuarii]